MASLASDRIPEVRSPRSESRFVTMSGETGVDMAVTVGVLALLEAKTEKGVEFADFLKGVRAIAVAGRLSRA